MRRAGIAGILSPMPRTCGVPPCQLGELIMATGWAGDGAVQDQIDATVKDGIERARRQLRQGPGLNRCEECDAEIPEARRRAVPGVRLCVACQQAHDRDALGAAGYNRRGSKDSQLR
jgi:phage/conjugal plasmid C-4 type zinc finger TraR family protein